MSSPTDTEMLDWLVSRVAQVLGPENTSHGGYVVYFYPINGGCPCAGPVAKTSRAAIQAAMEQDK